MLCNLLWISCRKIQITDALWSSFYQEDYRKHSKCKMLEMEATFHKCFLSLTINGKIDIDIEEYTCSSDMKAVFLCICDCVLLMNYTRTIKVLHGFVIYCQYKISNKYGSHQANPTDSC